MTIHLKRMELPEFNCLPPPLGMAAGQTVYEHWLTMSNLAACADIKHRLNRENTDIFMRDIFLGVN